MSRFYCCSDLHGNYRLYRRIKEKLAPDDAVICLGDCGDRGEWGWETLRAILNDEQFVLLKGNHEDMLVHAFEDLYEDDGTPKEEKSHKNVNLLYRNGGRGTFEAFLEDPDHLNYVSILRDLSTFLRYVNKKGQTIYLSHSGYYSPLTDRRKDIEDYFYIWDRSCCNLSDWNEESYVVHGHTPIPYLAEEFRLEATFPLWYTPHKVCIDCFSAYSNQTVLLDLDNFKSEIIMEL